MSPFCPEPGIASEQGVEFVMEELGLAEGDGDSERMDRSRNRSRHL